MHIVDILLSYVFSTNPNYEIFWEDKIMGTWSPALFADDMAMDIRREYSFLLSIGKDNKEIDPIAR